MAPPARAASEQATAAPAAAEAASLPSLEPIAVRSNAHIVQDGAVAAHSHIPAQHGRPHGLRPLDVLSAADGPSPSPPASTGAPDDSPSSRKSGNISSEGGRSSSSASSRGGASSSSGTPAVIITITEPANALLGVKAGRDSSAPPPARAEQTGSVKWLLSLRSNSSGSSSNSPSGTQAAAPKPRSKGRLGALTPAWWRRSKGRTCGIVAGVAVVVVMATLMMQLGVIGSQRSTLQMPVLRTTLQQSAAAPGSSGSGSVPRGTLGPPAHATDALQVLLQMYDAGQGLFRSMGWWNQANALEAVIDYALLTKSDDFNALLANTFDKTGELKYLGNYYDDEGWWGITWAKAYALTGRQAYRDVAVGIFRDMQNNGWQDSCGGGMLWRKGKGYRATISSGLYMMLAMLLHKSSSDGAEKDQYLRAAGQTWKWINTVGMLQSNGNLGDGMEGDCSLQIGQVYSYNQGVMMGALVMMGSVTGDSRYLATAYNIADAGIRAITNSAGIITEDCDPNYSNVDGCQFKGVFVRYLYDLYAVKKTPKYKKLLLDNAASAWNSRDKGSNKIGVSWRGNYVSKGDAEGITQTAALDLFNGVLGIKLHG